VAQEILGHASIATTTNYYDSRQVDEQLDAMQGQWESRTFAQPESSR